MDEEKLLERASGISPKMIPAVRAKKNPVVDLLVPQGLLYFLIVFPV